MPDLPSGGGAQLSRPYDGCTRLLTSVDVGLDHPVPMGVQCVFDGLDGLHKAFVDTGSEWSVMPYEVAVLLGISTEGGDRLSLHTRLGRLDGVLIRHTVRLPALVGTSLEVDATWLVSRDWPRGLVIGWRIFLENIAFGCEPGTTPEGEGTFWYAKR